MSRPANPHAMAPSKPGSTRTAPPQLPDRFPYGGRYLAYTLFDLTSDPDEQLDASDREPAVRAQLLAEMRRRYKDGLPATDPADEVELSPEDIERLRALGYAP